MLNTGHILSYKAFIRTFFCFGVSFEDIIAICRGFSLRHLGEVEKIPVLFRDLEKRTQVYSTCLLWILSIVILVRIEVNFRLLGRVGEGGRASVKILRHLKQSFGILPFWTFTIRRFLCFITLFCWVLSRSVFLRARERASCRKRQLCLRGVKLTCQYRNEGGPREETRIVVFLNYF